MTRKIKLSQQYLYFFGLLNCLCLLSCFINIKLGVLTSIIILFIFVTKFNLKFFIKDSTFIIYLIANIVSVISFAWNGRPISIFLSAISFNVLPALLYYVGRKMARENNVVSGMKKMLDAFIVMMSVGTITYLLMPNFYYSYIGVSIESYSYGLGEYRYGSFISSLALGSVGIISVILYFYLFDVLKKWQKMIYLPIILLNVLMCMQRAAWLLSAVSLFVCMLLKFGSEKKARMRIIGIAIILIIILVILWVNRASLFTQTQLEYFESRISSFTLQDMITSRNDQWIKAWEIFKENPIVGFGLGACGQKAAPYGLAVVTDGNHLRILSEIGVFGFLAFIYMNIKAIVRSIKSKNYYFALAVITYNIAATGSPVFDQFYSSFAYWIVLGCATTDLPTNKRNVILKRKRMI